MAGARPALAYLLGPERPDEWWEEHQGGHPGDCIICSGECWPIHGRHPAGCIVGRLGLEDFWIYHPLCRLWHGEEP